MTTVSTRKPPRGFERTGMALRCLGCGKVIQASGLGVGSHRRACKEQTKAMNEWWRRYDR